jgi:O-antigen/teichoic acid export membrane protein
VILLCFAPGLVTFVFGDRWRAAGEIMQVMVLPAYANLLYGSVNMVLTVLGAQRMEFIWQALRLAVVSTVWIVATRLHLGLMQIIIIHAGIVTTISLGYILVGDIVLGRFSKRPTAVQLD